MPEIRLLSDDIINKISAGEVIERPASVVKELLENSLDAGADTIRIEIVNGGTKLIRVADNGGGIAKAEVLTAMQRHATSKITSFKDLSSISTLGFRGEALPSIASVSKFTISTKTKDCNAGYSVETAGGKKPELRETGCPQGTTITISDLFFNTPARLKFLKSNTTETLHITNLVQQIALSHPEVSIELKEGKRTMVGPLPRNQDLRQRIASIYGNRIIENLVPVSTENVFIKLSGFITKPLLNYPNSRHQYFFVNNRSISSRLLAHAVMAGYGSLLENKRYPGLFLFIDIKADLIDVNIHPTKKEVRFINENAIHTLISETIQKTLRQKDIIPDIGEEISYRKQAAARDGRIREAISDYTHRNKSAYEPPSRTAFSRQEKFNYHKKQETFSEPLIEESVHPLAQINRTYIIAQDSDGMLIIDQHAAWERINYESFKKQYSKQHIESQALLIPINLELPPQNTKLLKDSTEFFERMGFEVSDFGPNSFIIKAIPAAFGDNIDYKQLLTDILDLLSESKEIMDSSHEINELTDSVFKIMACRASVKAGDNLSRTEMDALLKRLNSCQTPYSCPHGRPTMIKMSTNELEKRFKRR